MSTLNHSNVADYLLAGKEPEQVALCSLNGDHSYGELQRAANAIAQYLLGGLFKKGDRALLIADNSLFWAAAYLGTLQAGLVAVPLPPGMPAEDLDSILDITEARIAFVQAGVAVKNARCFQKLPLVADRKLPESSDATRVDFAGLVSATKPEAKPAPQVEPDDLAALMFTSGSTGTPHGVMVSHRNIIANTESIIEYLELTRQDRIMDVLPFHYCFGTSLLHTHLRAGGSIVMDHRFLYPEAVLERMQSTNCTGFAGVPSHYQILLRNSRLSRMTFPQLRYVQQAGGALAPAFLAQLRNALPAVRIFVMYGQTEATARLSYLPPELLDRKMGSIGKGIPGVRLQVSDESGQAVAPGETGEIVAEGANIAHGYWRAPEASAAIFRDGKLYTGDLATVDDEGFIYIAGRAKDMIKCGGRRVSGRHLEDQILACDGVEEAAVTGVADEVLGEAVLAFVVRRDNECGADCDWRACAAAREKIRSFCKQRLPAPQNPKGIVCVPQLPKNTAGKVLKPQLRFY